MRYGRQYLGLPILDGGIPCRDDLVQLVRAVASFEGTALIHCAAGHGRATLVAVAVLLARGRAPDIPAACSTIQRVRPRGRLMAIHHQLLELAQDELRSLANKSTRPDR